MILIFILLFLPTSISQDFRNQIVIWNVGQGQWVTGFDQTQCLHFDIGGEFYSAQKISVLCKSRKNYLFFSHWDWDHIGFANKLRQLSKSICVATEPNGRAIEYKLKFLNKIPKCNHMDYVETLSFNYSKAKKDNDYSRIYVYYKKLLIPGDSTKRMERVWSPLIKDKKLKWLFLAHHGSKTSTSKIFLKQYSSYEFAVASARKQVYGHPHRSVTNRLKEFKIPLLKTEDWGNIRILLN